MNIKDFILGYLIGKQDGGGGSSVEVESLSVTENGTYSEEGVAYSPVTVNVSGSGGLEYEEGTWTPSEDAARGTISFANQHTKAPVFVCISDVTDAYDNTQYTNYQWAFIDLEKLFGAPLWADSSTKIYAIYCWNGRTNNLGALNKNVYQLPNSSDDAGSSDQYPAYYATATEFHPYIADGRYWRASHTYKWLAIWK